LPVGTLRRQGNPSALYRDNGATYRSDVLRDACARRCVAGLSQWRLYVTVASEILRRRERYGTSPRHYTAPIARPFALTLVAAADAI